MFEIQELWALSKHIRGGPDDTLRGGGSMIFFRFFFVQQISTTNKFAFTPSKKRFKLTEINLFSDQDCRETQRVYNFPGRAPFKIHDQHDIIPFCNYCGWISYDTFCTYWIPGSSLELYVVRFFFKCLFHFGNLSKVSSFRWREVKCVKIQYCGEPPWQRDSMLGLRPPLLEFRIMSRPSFTGG